MLVIRAQAGDAQAMDQLARRWQRPLWRHARRLVGDREVAWDLVQEFWLAAVRGINRLRDPAHFRAWAYRIVTNKAADWIRRRGVRRKADETLETEARGRTAPSTPTDTTRLRSALRDLSADHRAVLHLKYREELGVNQIAELLDIPLGTVKSRLHHARQMLKERMERTPDERLG